MKIYSITDPEFDAYGRIVQTDGLDEILDALRRTPVPAGTDYVPEDPAIQSLPEAKKLAVRLFGGLPAEFGWCNGHNRKLNCLEYHRSSEFNLGTYDLILLVAKRDELVNFCLDTAKVKAFRVPAGVLVEIYATTLHFAPCHVHADTGVQMLVVLPGGTNLPLPEGAAGSAGKESEGTDAQTGEDRLLFAANKWLIAHAEAPDAANGAFVGLIGRNIDLDEEAIEDDAEAGGEAADNAENENAGEEAKRRYVISMLGNGYDAENIAYFCGVDKQFVLDTAKMAGMILPEEQ